MTFAARFFLFLPILWFPFIIHAAENEGPEDSSRKGEEPKHSENAVTGFVEDNGSSTHTDEDVTEHQSENSSKESIKDAEIETSFPQKRTSKHAEDLSSTSSSNILIDGNEKFAARSVTGGNPSVEDTKPRESLPVVEPNRNEEDFVTNNEERVMETPSAVVEPDRAEGNSATKDKEREMETPLAVVEPNRTEGNSATNDKEREMETPSAVVEPNRAEGNSATNDEKREMEKPSSVMETNQTIENSVTNDGERETELSSAIKPKETKEVPTTNNVEREMEHSSSIEEPNKTKESTITKNESEGLLLTEGKSITLMFPQVDNMCFNYKYFLFLINRGA